MVYKHALKLFLAGLIVLILSQNIHAGVGASVAIPNFPPAIHSVKTFFSYTNSSENIPATFFSAPNNKTVYVQINVSDQNGFEDIKKNGYVRVKIVLWNTTEDRDFWRFGSEYLDATFDSGSAKDAVYTYAFLMNDLDEARLGNETPPKFYRIKVEVYDGNDYVESDTSTEQVGNYTYQGTIPPLNVTVIFDIKIDIPENKKNIHPGDTFYSTVQITKVSPEGLADVSVEYSIVDPPKRTVDSYTEFDAINDTIYTLPVLFVPDNATFGKYTFNVLVMYLGVGSWAEANFNVVPTTTTTTTTSTTTTRHHGGGGNEETTEETTTTTVPPRISLDFYSVPSEVYAFKGETKPFMAVIENTGNVTVNNVKLALDTYLNVASILPDEVSISPGERKVFILEVEVPQDASDGAYPSVIKILTSRVEDQADITFMVAEKPSDYRKQLSQKIDDLTKLIDDVWNEAVEVSASQNTNNVSEVFNLLQRAKGKIEDAKDYMSYAKYNDTENSLDTSVKFIELGVVELAKIRFQAAPNQPNQTFTQTVLQTKIMDPNWIIVAAFFLIAGLFLILLRRNKKLSGQVREFYDLGRIKGMIFGKEIYKKDGIGSLSDSNKGKLN